jgi:ATP-dependent DNA helicase PIF1
MNTLILQDVLEGRTILAPTNKEVDALNEVIQDWLPKAGVKLLSADTLENPEDSFRFNTEYLNTLKPNGFPQHILNLKSGMPLMLLRNINPRQSLCNGTRLIFDKCIDNNLLQCRIVESGRIVLIQRITFIPKPRDYPIEWQRRQFPARPAFAMTSHKVRPSNLLEFGSGAGLHPWPAVCGMFKGQLSKQYQVCTYAGPTRCSSQHYLKRSSPESQGIGYY